MGNPTSSTRQFVDGSTMLRVGHIPATARMCHRPGLSDLINRSIPCNTGLDLGTLVTGMICDTPEKTIKAAAKTTCHCLGEASKALGTLTR